ncbi:unnamed protein product [Arabis nemorensis]|uniref:Uncharacterized protein n=1 Tax=Arabis nemorensis TaxID=586526 RepID=A0A565BMM6_9BRAS|nr:unnamed protein product [Arabis nemorensis]
MNSTECPDNVSSRKHDSANENKGKSNDKYIRASREIKGKAFLWHPSLAIIKHTGWCFGWLPILGFDGFGVASVYRLSTRAALSLSLAVNGALLPLVCLISEETEPLAGSTDLRVYQNP